MTFLDDLGLRAAAGLETSVGPFIALAAYRRLFAGEGATREAAILGALRCAIQLADEEAIKACAEAWRSQPVSRGNVLAEAGALLRAGRGHAAHWLASAELARSRSAHAAYIDARSCEVFRLGGDHADPFDVIELWWSVVLQAQASSDERVTAFAAARFAGLAFARAARDPSYQLPRARLALACENARDELLETREARLALLRGKLLAAGRFARASALSSLESLARLRGSSIAERAVVIALRHLDNLPGRISPVERDRVAACAKHIEHVAVRERVIALVKDVAAEPSIASSNSPLFELGRRAETCVDDPSEAGPLLQQAAGLLSPELSVPVALSSLAVLTLHKVVGDAAEPSVAFLDAMLCRTAAFPAFELSAIGLRLLDLGKPTVADRYLEEAVRLREEKALLLRGQALRERGYSELRSGRDEEAWRLLSEARVLLRGS